MVPMVNASFLGLAVLLGQSDFRQAESMLADQFDISAQRIATDVRAKGENSVVVGHCTVDPFHSRINGELIRKSLELALNRHAKMSVKRDGRMQVDLRVRFEVLPGQESKSSVKIEFELVDGKGARAILPEATFRSRDDRLVAVLVPGSFAFDPKVDPSERIRRMSHHFTALIDGKAQPPHLSEQRYQITDGQDRFQLGMVVRRGTDWVPLQVRWPQTVDERQAGTAFVELNPDDQYAVRLVNRHPWDAAVELYVDGRSVFSYSDDRLPGKPGLPKYDFLIIPANSQDLIKGWHINNQSSAAFLVMTLPKLAEKENIVLLPPDKVGTVTAVFRYAWEKGERPAEIPQSDIVTGKGPPIQVDFKEVFREVSNWHTKLEIRYVRPGA